MWLHRERMQLGASVTTKQDGAFKNDDKGLPNGQNNTRQDGDQRRPSTDWGLPSHRATRPSLSCAERVAFPQYRFGPGGAGRRLERHRERSRHIPDSRRLGE